MYILEIIIGLVFVILLFSLLATTIMELVSGIFALRGHNLVKGIKHILAHDGDDYLFKQFKNSELYKQLCAKRSWSNHVYRPPSYISSNSFWVILSGLIFKGTSDSINEYKEKLEKAPIGNHLKNVLIQLAEDAEKEDFLRRRVDKVKKSVEFLQNEEIKNQIISYADGVEEKVVSFKTKVEHWYDDVMDRTSGWYKRQTQLILFVLGMLIAIGFNVDIIQIYQILSKNPELALRIANEAQAYVSNNPTLEAQLNTEILELLKRDIAAIQSPLGIGWDFKAIPSYGISEWLLKLVGWLVTALSITLGAPFWFDLLRKLVNIRSAGVKPNVAA
jgi:CRISPR/Cas system CMR-associated protein Cmr5 small subunit